VEERVRRQAATTLVLVAIGLTLGGKAAAAVTDVAITDVTTRACAVAWVSDAPVNDATVRVFADPAGTTELTGGLTVTLASASIPTAHGLGLVKVEVTGLSADTSVYLQTQTTTAGGIVPFPAVPPFLEVHTAVATTRADMAGTPIVNDVITHTLMEPDGVTPATGALMLVELPGLAAAPLSAFVGEGAATPTTLVDLNNLFDLTGATLQVPDEAVLRITEYRGGLCADLAEQRLVRFRRLPPPSPGPALTEAVTPVPCFFADPVCDDVVDILDVQWVLNRLGRVLGECGFHPDLDVVTDNAIDILDVQGVLNRFGESAPFVP